MWRITSSMISGSLISNHSNGSSIQDPTLLSREVVTLCVLTNSILWSLEAYSKLQKNYVTSMYSTLKQRNGASISQKS